MSKIEGYLLIPHELLHVAGYRLVGRKCRYRLGDPYVIPPGSMTRREQLIGLLFPFAVFAGLFVLSILLLGFIPLIVKYYEGNVLLWIGMLGSLSVASVVYVCTTIGDLRQAYLIIYDKPPDSETPFDFFETWHLKLQSADRPLIFFLIFLCLAALVYSLRLN